MDHNQTRSMVFILLICPAKGGKNATVTERDVIGGTDMGKELEQMLKRKEEILAGDAARVKAQHDAGKLTARERIDKVQPAPAQELAVDAGYIPPVKGTPTAGLMPPIEKIPRPVEGGRPSTANEMQARFDPVITAAFGK